MRINARFALPAVGVVAGAALIAAMPAEAQPQSQTNNEASVVTPAAKQAAIASAEKQEASSALRHQEAVKAAADKAAADKAAGREGGGGCCGPGGGAGPGSVGGRCPGCCFCGSRCGAAGGAAC